MTTLRRVTDGLARRVSRARPAVRDAEFRTKSKARVIDLTAAAKGIVLVTHDMAWVEEYCNRAILLEEGHVIVEGDPAEVVRTHIEHSRARKADRAARLGTSAI